MLSIDDIIAAIPHALLRVDVSGLGPKTEGKVRDIYVKGDHRYLIASDRISAFDRVLSAIPFKGQVLNQISAWWFKQTEDIVQNHVIAIPDPNVTLAHNAQVLPVEVIVRGYITGVTDTALWTLYNNGVERPYGLILPEGLQKNDRLESAVITPTTKAGPGEHDERLTSKEVTERGLVEPKLWQEVQDVALALFKRGQSIAAERGLILVDTKYEFGLVNGKLTLIDEIHTPDSSRYWFTESYAQNRAGKGELKSFDKEYVRRWLASQGFRGEGDIPPFPPEIIAQAAQRYITAFEQLTGETFTPGAQPLQGRIAQNLKL